MLAAIFLVAGTAGYELKWILYVRNGGYVEVPQCDWVTSKYHSGMNTMQIQLKSIMGVKRIMG